MFVQSFDIIIIGAGPAGLTAAIFLKDSGLKIALVDKSATPGEKVCGDALSGSVMSVLRRMPGDIYTKFLEFPNKMPSNGIRFYSPDHHFLDVPFIMNKDNTAASAGYLCKRKDFDRFLSEQIREEPAITHFMGFKVSDIEADADGITVSDGNRELRASLVLGADGQLSKTREMLAGKAIDHLHDSLGVRTYFANVKDLHQENFIELHFFKKLLPGYLWIFPMPGNEVNVGLGLPLARVKKEKLNLSSLLLDLINNEPSIKDRFSGATMTGKPEAHGLALGPPEFPLSGDRLLLAGDAAGLVDPFSGEGIGNAMLSGEIAARVMMESFRAGDHSSAFLHRYDERINQKISGELKLSRKIQSLAGSSFLFNFVIRKAGKNKEMAKIFSEMYTKQDAKKRLTNPLFYLRFIFS
jgi:menaquinone-9 beta-reductase